MLLQFSQDVKKILGDKLTKVILYGSYARGKQSVQTLHRLLSLQLHGPIILIEYSAKLNYTMDNEINKSTLA